MTIENISVKYKFTEAFKDDYLTLWFSKGLETAVCRAELDYIPISHFKKMFLFVSEFIESTKIVHFVFDKSKLRTFHQPSMEWYFAIWKPNLKTKGLVNHYKILPDLDWFAKAVEAGKQEIFQKYGTDILKGIHITYMKSVIDVLTKIENERNQDNPSLFLSPS